MKADERLSKAARDLAEHYESVIIIAVTRSEDGGASTCTASGSGNFYSQFGSVREWILFKEEESRIEARRLSEEMP